MSVQRKRTEITHHRLALEQRYIESLGTEVLEVASEFLHKLRLHKDSHCNFLILVQNWNFCPGLSRFIQVYPEVQDFFKTVAQPLKGKLANRRNF